MTASVPTSNQTNQSVRHGLPWKGLILVGLLGGLLVGALAFPYLWRAWVENRYAPDIYELDVALDKRAQ